VCDVYIVCNIVCMSNATACCLGRNSAPHFMKVQLGDQTDSKMLLGSYRCTDVPGEFVWQPGVLTQVRVMTGQPRCFTLHRYVRVTLYSLNTTGPFHRDKVAVCENIIVKISVRALVCQCGEILNVPKYEMRIHS
jgi:hypothetical protein